MATKERQGTKKISTIELGRLPFDRTERLDQPLFRKCHASIPLWKGDQCGDSQLSQLGTTDKLHLQTGRSGPSLLTNGRRL